MADPKWSRWRSHGPWLLFVAAVVVTSVATHVPLRGFASTLSERYDKLLHFMAYGVMSLLGGWAMSRWRWGLGCSAAMVGVLVGLDEFFQAWVPSRTVDRVDALAGWFGVGAGTVLAWGLRSVGQLRRGGEAGSGEISD